MRWRVSAHLSSSTGVSPMEDNAQLYAIWLMPESTVYGSLSSIIDHLAESSGTARFRPHATLCTGKWSGKLGILKAKVNVIAKQSGKLQVATCGLDHRNKNFQFFYISLYPDGIQPVVDCVRQELPLADFPPDDVGPHLSLMYSRQFDRIDRADLTKKLASKVPAHIQFDGLTLVLTKNNRWDDIDNWLEAHYAAFNE